MTDQSYGSDGYMANASNGNDSINPFGVSLRQPVVSSNVLGFSLVSPQLSETPMFQSPLSMTSGSSSNMQIPCNNMNNGFNNNININNNVNNNVYGNNIGNNLLNNCPNYNSNFMPNFTTIPNNNNSNSNNGVSFNGSYVTGVIDCSRNVNTNNNNNNNQVRYNNNNSSNTNQYAPTPNQRAASALVPFFDTIQFRYPNQQQNRQMMTQLITNYNNNLSNGNNDQLSETAQPYNKHELESEIFRNLTHIRFITDIEKKHWGDIDRFNATLNKELMSQLIDNNNNNNNNNGMNITLPQQKGVVFMGLANLLLYNFAVSSKSNSNAAMWFVLFDRIGKHEKWERDAQNLIVHYAHCRNMNKTNLKWNVRSLKQFISEKTQYYKKDFKYKDENTMKEFFLSNGVLDTPLIMKLMFLSWHDHVCYASFCLRNKRVDVLCGACVSRFADVVCSKSIILFGANNLFVQNTSIVYDCFDIIFFLFLFLFLLCCMIALGVYRLLRVATKSRRKRIIIIQSKAKRWLWIWQCVI